MHILSKLINHPPSTDNPREKKSENNPFPELIAAFKNEKDSLYCIKSFVCPQCKTILFNIYVNT